MGRMHKPLRTLVVAMLMLASVPVVALAQVSALAPESEPNDYPSQANDLMAPDFQGTVNDTSDTDDTYRIALNAGDEIELRLQYTWSNPDPADIPLELYGPGTDDTFNPPSLEYSGSFGLKTQFVRYTVQPGAFPAQDYYPDVYAADTLGTTVSYTLDASVNNTVDISGVERYWGDTRYGTALDTSYQTFANGSCPTAVIATGQNFPDALAASGLAGAVMGPLLLTPSAELYGGIPDELSRLGVTKVYIVGGTSAVNAAVQTDLTNLGYTVERISGLNRYQTATKVAEEVAAEWGGSFKADAFVVRGDSFPDALACAPFSATQGVPILLTPPTSLSSETEKFIDDYNIDTVYIAGGTSAVSSATQFQIDALNTGSTVVYRFGGNNRYQTAAVLANDMVRDHGMNSFTEVGIATGYSFPDALAGGAAVGSRNGVLLLTPKEGLDQYAEDVMRDNMFQGDDVVVFGGDVAIQTMGAMKDAWDVALSLP